MLDKINLYVKNNKGENIFELLDYDKRNIFEKHKNTRFLNILKNKMI
jgi:hypothetical protein